MRYREDALTIDRQVELLAAKGLVDDNTGLSSSLGKVSYHRLSGY
jgi:abortive infection bacteriophage resistance protein